MRNLTNSYATDSTNLRIRWPLKSHYDARIHLYFVRNTKTHLQDIKNSIKGIECLQLILHTAYAYVKLDRTFDIIYCISTVNTQHMQRPDVLVQLGYIWRHVSAVKRPSSGQQGIVLYWWMDLA